MAITRGPRVVTSGATLALDAADRNSYPGSGTLWTDLSGNRNNGTLTNGPTFAGANGGGIVFDGTNDYVNTSSAALYAPSGTICVWIKSGTPSDIYNSHSAGQNQISLWGQSGNLNFKIGDGNIPVTLSISSSLVFDNIFHSISTTWVVGGERAIWLDGVKLTAQGTTAQFTPSSIFEIGYKSWSPVYYSGSMYGLISYNRVLTATEILQNFNASRARFGI
jgi:hypothetical protein